MQAVAAARAAGEHSQAGGPYIHGSTDQPRSILDLLRQQQKSTKVITPTVAGPKETPSNKRDSTKSFSTRSSGFDSTSADTAITVNNASQNAVFSQTISMDNIEGWEVVRAES